MNPAQLELKIWYNEKGMPMVHGPLMDKNLCYKMLFDAALLVKDYDPNKKIVEPKTGDIVNITKNKGGKKG